MPAHLYRVLDVSKVSVGGHSYTGAIIEHRRLDGAVACSILHPPEQRIDPHAHDWPVLTLYRLGGYREESDGADIELDGPSVVFHPAGATHADVIGPAGLETVALTFDPAWLGEARSVLPTQSRWWIGGEAAMAARTLAALCVDASVDSAALQRATALFVRKALARPSKLSARTPHWGARVAALIDGGSTTDEIARALARHPAWIARAYRAWRGEGVTETARRRRVERAVLMLRAGGALADVAAAVDFCDQSHMNRAFRSVLGRTPKQVRAEAPLLAAL